jgi:hypothetical protein
MYESANNVVSDYQAEEVASLVLKLAQIGKRTYKRLSEFTAERAGCQMNSWEEKLGDGLFILSICSCGCLANEMTGFPLVGCRTRDNSLVHCFGPDEETSVSLIRCLGRRFSYCFFD